MVGDRASGSIHQGSGIERHGQGARRSHRSAGAGNIEPPRSPSTRYALAPPGFPATSVAFTVNVWVPSEVSIGSPSATGPAQVARPEPPASSAQS